MPPLGFTTGSTRPNASPSPAVWRGASALHGLGGLAGKARLHSCNPGGYECLESSLRRTCSLGRARFCSDFNDLEAVPKRLL